MIDILRPRDVCSGVSLLASEGELGDQRTQRRLAAVLAADVAGYSRLMGRDEDGTHAALKGHLAELIEPSIAEHGGRVVKRTGERAAC